MDKAKFHVYRSARKHNKKYKMDLDIKLVKCVYPPNNGST